MGDVVSYVDLRFHRSAPRGNGLMWSGSGLIEWGTLQSTSWGMGDVASFVALRFSPPAMGDRANDGSGQQPQRSVMGVAVFVAFPRRPDMLTRHRRRGSRGLLEKFDFFLVPFPRRCSIPQSSPWRPGAPSPPPGSPG